MTRVCGCSGSGELGAGFHQTNSLVLPPRRSTPRDVRPLNARINPISLAEKELGSASCCTSYERPIKSAGMWGPVASAGRLRGPWGPAPCAHEGGLRQEKGGGGGG